MSEHTPFRKIAMYQAGAIMVSSATLLWTNSSPDEIATNLSRMAIIAAVAYGIGIIWNILEG